jgi:hypothetical protein
VPNICALHPDLAPGRFGRKETVDSQQFNIHTDNRSQTLSLAVLRWERGVKRWD